MINPTYAVLALGLTWVELYALHFSMPMPSLEQCEQWLTEILIQRGWRRVQQNDMTMIVSPDEPTTWWWYRPTGQHYAYVTCAGRCKYGDWRDGTINRRPCASWADVMRELLP